MSNFKASRPDPVKVLEEMRDVAARMDAAAINLKEVGAEVLDFNARAETAAARFKEESDAVEARYEAEAKPFDEERATLKERKSEAQKQYNDARDAAVTAQFKFFEVMIEDMKN